MTERSLLGSSTCPKILPGTEFLRLADGDFLAARPTYFESITDSCERLGIPDQAIVMENLIARKSACPPIGESKSDQLGSQAIGDCSPHFFSWPLGT